ncbi:MAG: hypothetical protein SPD80_02710 [Atopobium sp.]|uniref:hypothetical protein n=1 Tax=Atopobium sp. TaxID=1872650 RepID=UPI002A81E3E1|nr:hypothetical protein [Atopobium sp.]MDY4522490.1 hypothetical protein [Atopobium sp.]
MKAVMASCRAAATQGEKWAAQDKARKLEGLALPSWNDVVTITRSHPAHTTRLVSELVTLALTDILSSNVRLTV